MLRHMSRTGICNGKVKLRLSLVLGTKSCEIDDLSCLNIYERCVVSSTGVLLHYDDTSLQDIYFLDPQWLCDVLASVVTIREINSLAKSGQCLSLSLVYTVKTMKTSSVK